MSVLDRGYRRWRGTPTPYLERVLVIPRYDLREILSRKVWLMSYVACLVPPFVLGAVAYFTTNLSLIRKLIPLLPPQIALPTPGADTYAGFTWVQLFLCVGFALLVGPPLATRDFANSAIPLYLSKALRRFDYVLGRWAVLLLLLSLATWIPLLLVFGLQAGMSKPEWRSANGWLAGAIVAGCIPVVVLLTALVTAVAAYVHRSNVARAALLALVLVTRPLGAALEGASGSPYGQVVSPLAMAATINTWAFSPPEKRDELLTERSRELTRSRGRASAPATSVPVPVAFLVLGAWLAGCVGVLAWRVRPVEVVK